MGGGLAAGMMAGALGLLMGGCGASGEFMCQADVQCVAQAAGQCQPDGYCSFPDADCPSGQRYAEHGGSHSGQCVGASLDTEVTNDGSGSSTRGPPGDSSGAGSTGEPTTSGVTTGLPMTTSTDTSSGEESTGMPVDPDLVLWLELEPAPEGEVPDSSSYMAGGLCVPPGCPAAGQGALGEGVLLDGSDDVIFVPHAVQLETSEGFTVAAWIRLPEPPSGHRAVLTKAVGLGISNSWELFFVSETLHFGMRTVGGDYAGVMLPGPFAVDEWTHLAGTWDGQQMTLWVDGQTMGSADSLSIEFDDQPVLVGADDDHESSVEGLFSGGIDDVRIYRRALAPDEVLALASAGGP